jgi:hypothetical protein
MYMSDKHRPLPEHSDALDQKCHEIVKEETAAKAETMERDPPKKCCKVDPTVKSVCQCCLSSWSLCLNGVEGCCSGMSICCIFFSDIALGCNKCLEQIDCDGH